MAAGVIAEAAGLFAVTNLDDIFTIGAAPSGKAAHIIGAAPATGC
jgi:hypothetical protein